MKQSSILRTDAPQISTALLTRLLRVLLPKDLNGDATLFDLGYEACKRDLARTLANEINLPASSNPAPRMLNDIEHG